MKTQSPKEISQQTSFLFAKIMISMIFKLSVNCAILSLNIIILYCSLNITLLILIQKIRLKHRTDLNRNKKYIIKLCLLHWTTIFGTYNLILSLETAIIFTKAEFFAHLRINSIFRLVFKFFISRGNRFNNVFILESFFLSLFTENINNNFLIKCNAFVSLNLIIDL